MREVQEVMRMESELRSLIHLMVARHATDAHLTLRFGRLTLRLRCPERMIDDDSGLFDGRLLHYLKYISHLDLGAMSTPQSGSFTRQYQDRLLQFRFACLGTQQLQTGVLRLLNLQDLTRIEEICNDADKRALFHALCHQRHGLALLSGPTGSGKSTTLHALMHEAATFNHLQVITLEDPIEITDSSYVQLQVNEKNGFTYEVGIRELLRHDPDIIMIAEVRSVETAHMIVRAALSGHMVFTTVHAKSCAEVFARMREFGVPMHDLRQTVTFVSTQRLLLNAERNGKECIYEVLHGEALRRFMEEERLPAGHLSIEEEIKSAWERGRIACGVLEEEIGQ